MVEPVLIVLGVMAVAIVLFMTERVPPDLVALVVVVALALTGVLTPSEALAGFGNPATITVLSMFVLSAGVFQTGIVSVLVNRLHRLGAGREATVIIAIALIVGPVSAFINNTAAVAILLPLVISLATESKRAPSRFLIPLSYASQMGGVLTLLGTSTNILASQIALESGHRTLGMFEFAPVGLIIFGVGAVYLVLIAPRLLPHRGRVEEEFGPEFVAHLVVTEGTTAVGLPAASKDATVRLGGRVLEVRRAGHRLEPREATLQAGDIVAVEGAPHALLHAEAGGRFRPFGRSRFKEGMTVEQGYTAVEVVIAPGSAYIGNESGLSRLGRMDAYAVGIHRKERFGPSFFAPDIEAGDTLLVVARKDRLAELRDARDLILAQEVPLVEFRRHRLPHVIAIFVGVVGLAAMGILPIAVTALSGAVLMVATGILDMRQFYNAIRWDVVILLAGLIPLGTAFVKTGGAALLAGWLSSYAGALPPWGLLLATYVMTAILTEFLSNNGTVVLMVPISVSAAMSLALDPTPFVLAVAYAASTSFMTPVGYQTNTMVYGPGGYRFSDYFRVGAPLNLMLALITTASLVWFYGL